MWKKISLLSVIHFVFVLGVSAQCIEGNCYDSNGTFLFENGDRYKGQWKKGVENGYGVYEFANGDVYKGAWKGGLMDGRGTFTYNNGDKYIGAWKDGKMNGRGHFHWDLPGDLMTNAKYEGYFKAGVPQNIDIPVTGMPADPPKSK
ncbi:MAG: hypothetical protein JKX84_11690 [Flavobacteriales bacterium]|nr:hypothetical protein [Flavobacteriales bacterium]